MFCIFTLIFDQKLADDSFYKHVINKISESQFTTNIHFCYVERGYNFGSKL
jgi:hypothetical protein